MAKPSSARREIYNQSINSFWTACCFLPVGWFWFYNGPDRRLYWFIGVSLLVSVLPQKFLDLFQLSTQRKVYERLGVKIIRRLVQNGDWVKAGTRANSLQLIQDTNGAKKYLNTLAMYERFHCCCFLFFLLTAVYAWYRDHTMLAIGIMVTNLLYNVSAILLQQYNRLRIKRVLSYNRELPASSPQ
ncbi:MAG TPA: hypothetical protein VMI35_09185 [Puia sp.]|nr:hypothetical protein [Puia sp.]